MHDLRRYRSEAPPVTGLASITLDDRGVEQSPADGDRTAWKGWVSASKTRNWLRRDPLLDWLEVHGEAKGFEKDPEVDAEPPSPYDLRRLLFAKGNAFEAGIFALLEPKVASWVKIANGWEETRSLDAARRTFEAMRSGVELIEQAVVRNPEDQTYGAVDLLARSDTLAKLFPGSVDASEAVHPAPALAGADGVPPPWHYLVVDVKFSTLDLSVNGLVSSSHRHYAGQVLVYTAAVARLQGYCAAEAYLLGRTWTSSKGRGRGAFDRLGRVIVEREAARDDAAPLAIEVGRAIEWIRSVRRDGASWEVLPRPTRPELYPNTGAGEDQPWSAAKRRIADSIGELTVLPGVSPELRDAAIGRGILRRDEPNLSPESLGVGGDARPKRLAVVLAANHPDQAARVAADPGAAVIPDRIQLPPDLERHWRTPWRIEFCVDFENTQNLDDDFSRLPEVGGRVCIFQVGCLVQIDGRAPTAAECAAAGVPSAFGQWTAKRLSLAGEREVLDSWRAFMDAWRGSLGAAWSEARIMHWSPAEPNLLTNSYNCAADRHPDWSLPDDLGWFDALDELVHRVPLGVRGAWGFGLKQIAKGMHAAGLIETVWGDGPADGLGAMAAAYEAERRAALNGGSLSDCDFMRLVAEYNEVDCRAMSEVVGWLRANR